MKTRKPDTIVYNPEFSTDSNYFRWIEHASKGLRVVGDATDFLPYARHTGYYLDPLGDGDTVRGAVLQLPGRDGLARFVPAVVDPWNDDCFLVDFRDVQEAPGHDCEEAKEEAARAADHMAEQYAEREREYQTLEGAKQAIEEARERIREERQAAHALASEMRSFASWRNDAAPAICKTLHNEMKRRRAAVSAAVKEIRDLTRNPGAWLEA